MTTLPGGPPHYLREWRQAKGLTLEELARRLDTSKGVISRYETFQRNLTVELQFQLADALGIWVGQLFLPPDQLSVDALLVGAPKEVWDEIGAIAKRIRPRS